MRCVQSHVVAAGMLHSGFRSRGHCTGTAFPELNHLRYQYIDRTPRVYCANTPRTFDALDFSFFSLPLLPQLSHMGLDARGYISIVEIIIYIPILLIGVVLSLRHGFKRKAGWIMLVILSISTLNLLCDKYRLTVLC